MQPTTEQRFFSKVLQGQNCWEWTAYRSKQGYGRFQLDGSSQLAHRVAWKLKHGQIPAGKDVLHRCDNPPCVRDEHLFIGTDFDNQRDCVSKGRRPVQTGQLNGNAKLTPDQIVRIRALSSLGVPKGSIARNYGVSSRQIGRIVNREHWAKSRRPRGESL